MKNKITAYILAAMTIVFLVITILFVNVLSYQRKENIKENFGIYNRIVGEFLQTKNNDENMESLFDQLSNLEIRVVLMDLKGRFQFDSYGEYNKSFRLSQDELKEVLDKGEIYIFEETNVSNKEKIYCISKEGKYIIQVSKIITPFTIKDKSYILIYFTSMGLIFLFAIWLSSKLSYIIVKPIEDLDNTAYLIAKGKLDRRVKITDKGEIGHLGESVNEMANKLEYTLGKVTEKQNRLSAILESMDSGVIAIDNNSKLIMINPYVEKIFGLSAIDIGKSVEEIYNGSIIKKFFNDEDYNEIKIDKPNEIYLRIRITNIINRNNKIGKVAVIQDITDIKKLENVRSEFVANVSHELKTPLTSIKGFAETLKYVDDDETRKKFLHIIDEEAERLTRLISDILILSDIERKKKFKKESIDVNKVVNDVSEIMKNVCKNKNIDIIIEGEEIPNLLGDTDKLKQMLINLVDNSIKYSESKEIIMRKLKKENNCILEVEDKGIGISEEHISRIFERFYRVDKARSRASGGTGLGLAIVKHIVINFNGNIEVCSKIGVGTKFTITIPYNQIGA